MPSRYDRLSVKTKPKMFIKLNTNFRPPLYCFWIVFALTSGYLITIDATDKYQNMINCDIHQNACTKHLSTCTITLEINPKPIKAMRDLFFRVILSGNLPVVVKAPHIDLEMPGMNMGPNRVILKSMGPGVYEGKGIIIRCPSGRKVWQATVTIPDIGQAKFIFDVIY